MKIPYGTKIFWVTIPHKSCLTPWFFYCGLYFALHSGQEHRHLQLSQIELIEPEGESPYLVYTENFSKNNCGGLAQRRVEAKTVAHHANQDNPTRCFVRLFEEYRRRLPETVDNTSPFYLHPLKNPKTDTWYSTTSVGHNTLSMTVKRLCAKADITGFKTNHSLRVTNATRLFQSGAAEQLIMERTGHHSLDGVHAYKRTSDEQQKSVSNVLNSATNGTPASAIQSEAPKKLKLDQSLPPLSFTGCNNVVINFGTPSSSNS